MNRKKKVAGMENEQKKEDTVWTELSEEQQLAVKKLQNTMTEEALWECVIQFQQYLFQTASGLPFHYEIKRGRRGKLNRELLIDRREGSKSLTWSSFRAAFACLMEDQPEDGSRKYVIRPKGLGDVRGVSYIYPMFHRFGIIEVPEKYELQMKGRQL